MMSHGGKSTKRALARLLAVVMTVSLLASVLPAVALAASANNASFTSSSIPAAMVAGRRYTVKITVKNTGTTTWTAAAGYKLVCTNGASSLANKAGYALPASVKPNASVTFTVLMTAPLKKMNITTAWKMSEGTAKFGAALTKKIAVTIPANGCIFVASNIPSKVTVSADTDNTVTLFATFKNIGSVKWTNKAGFSLMGTLTLTVPVLGSASEPFTVSLSPKDAIATGETKKFILPEAVSMFDIEGGYVYTVQMAYKGVKFGPVFTKKVSAKFSLDALYENVGELVSMAEYLDDQHYLNLARYFTDELPAGSRKDGYESRLDAVQAILDLPGQQKDAIAAIKTAFTKYKAADYSSSNWSELQQDEAAGIANIQLTTTKAEVDSAKDAAIAEMAAVKTKAQEAEDAASAAVVKAEGSKLQADVDAARALVNVLPEGAVKTDLNTRLDAIVVI